MSSFEETLLWKELAKRTDESSKRIREDLPRVLRAAETVLKSGQTAPLDFTLHDDEHAMRVADRMIEIIPSSSLEALTGYELAMLLLMAYIHDIGMNPSKKHSSNCWNHIMFGEQHDSTELDADTKREIDDWLDDNNDELKIPLVREGRTSKPEDIRQADLLTAHYCRYKHADWCEDWLEDFREVEILGTYDAWKPTLALLCKSHAMNKQRLLADEFDPIRVGENGDVLHLRYLACILRVSDVVDIDPKRTPDVVYKHRDVSKGSQIYWRKDHNSWVNIKEDEMTFVAYPTKAYLEKAMWETAEQIENELRAVKAISREKPFGESALGVELAHSWNMSSLLNKTIKARPDTYVYIEGAFRPSHERLMELLSGYFLYTEELTAIRELLLNAFDATAKRDAQEKLWRIEQHSEIDSKAVAKTHRVILKIKLEEDRIWLDCSDEGIGMTKEVITNSLLISGNEKDKYTRRLVRHCEKNDTELEIAARFGIGVLSYFSIADKAIVSTKRLADLDDADGDGWRFETMGVGSFGELKRERRSLPGTTVKLRLREEYDDLETFHEEVMSYIKRTFTKVPWDVYVVTDLEGREQWHIPKGWVPIENLEEEIDPLEYESPVDSNLGRHIDEKLYTKHETEQQKKRRENHEATDREFKDRLRWEEETGDLPGRMGTYRIRLPYFEYPNGKCLAFIRPESSEGKNWLKAIGKGNISLPKFHDATISWYGVKAAYEFGPYEEIRSHLGHITMDLTGVEGACVDLSRETITIETLSWAGIDAYHYLCNRAQVLGAKITDGGEFEPINTRLHQQTGVDAANQHWIRETDDEEPSRWEWTPVKYPVSEIKFVEWFASGLLHIKEHNKIAMLKPLRSHKDEWDDDKIFWHTNYTPDRLVIRDTAFNRGYLVPIWTGENLAKKYALGPSMKFPQGWEQVASLTYFMHSFEVMGDRSERIVNEDNTLVRLVREEHLEDLCGGGLSSTVDKVFLDALLSEPGRAAAWVITELMTNQYIHMWNNIVEVYPEYPRQLWSVLFPRDNQPSNIMVLQLSDSYWSVMELRLDSQNTFNWPNDERKIRTLLPVNATVESPSASSS